MMTSKDMTGIVFQNDKGDNQNRPDYKGEGMVGNVPIWISLWKKKDKNGKTFLSLSFKIKEAKSTEEQPF